MSDRSIDLWKMVGTGLFGACLSGVVFFVREGNTHATHDELRAALIEAKDFAEKAGPYVRDKGTLFTRLDSIDANLADIKAKLDRGERADRGER